MEQVRSKPVLQFRGYDEDLELDLRDLRAEIYEPPGGPVSRVIRYRNHERREPLHMYVVEQSATAV